MTCRRDMSVIRIAVNRDCNLINVIVNFVMNKFINHYLFIKKTSSSVLSVFHLDI